MGTAADADRAELSEFRTATLSVRHIGASADFGLTYSSLVDDFPSPVPVAARCPVAVEPTGIVFDFSRLERVPRDPSTGPSGDGVGEENETSIRYSGLFPREECALSATPCETISVPSGVSGFFSGRKKNVL